MEHLESKEKRFLFTLPQELYRSFFHINEAVKNSP